MEFASIRCFLSTYFTMLASVMEFCDLDCKYAKFPKSDAVDGSRSCRTFVALHCMLRKKLVHKNLPCKDKVIRKR